MNCPKCGKPITSNARFCGSCGQMIEAPAPVPPASAAPAMAGAGATASAAAVGAAAWTAPSAGSGLFNRIKNIILSPKTEWPVIEAEPTTPAQLYTGYVMPLAAAAALLMFVRMYMIGVGTVFGGAMRMPLITSLGYLVYTLVASLVAVFVVALIINALAPTFSGVRDQRQALKVAAYGFTPGWLASVLALSPILPTLLQLVAFIYGLYVLYLGLPVLMHSAREKAFGYTAAVIVCCFVLGIVLGGVSMALMRAGHVDAFGGMGASSPQSEAAAREQGAAAVGNEIGGLLGTDAQGKAGLGAALSNLAKAGEAAQLQAAGAPSAAAPSSATPSAAPAADAQSPLAATGGLLSALGGALGGANRVDTVDFKTLTGLLPTSLPGMQRTDAVGENQGAMGVKTSSAHADYQGNGTSLHMEITDMSGVSGLMDLANGLIQNTTSESANGYEKDVTLGGRTVHEKWDAGSKKGDLSVMLAKRFQVEVTGAGPDMSALEQALGKVDLAKLESMKDVGAQAK